METAYIEHNGKVCIAAATLLDAGLATKANWDDWMKSAKKNGYTTRPGGNGRPSLIELIAIPTKHRERIIAQFGSPDKQFNALEEFFVIDAQARIFYQTYRHPVTAKGLEAYQIDKYTINASMLNAIDRLKQAREIMTKRLGNAKRDLKEGLSNDSIAFQHVLKGKYKTIEHTLPKHPRKLMEKLAEYKRLGYGSLIDGRAQNSNAQVVTDEMIDLWNAMFAGQKHKPSYYEVANKYSIFLKGKLEIVNPATGEVYDPTAECFKEVSERSVLNYLSTWTNRIATHSLRSGDRQKYMGKYIPYRKMERPRYAGSILSVDDRQPPFKWGEGMGNRMWFYMGQDLASTAFITFVYGETKEGIIIDFYRQLVRDHALRGLCLPYELEAEASLNSNYVNTFLANGAMFQKTHIIANMARSKRIERDFGTLRNSIERTHEEFISRPHAQDENLQAKAGKVTYLPKDRIIEKELRLIEEWNNSPHPDQAMYPGKTRWDVYLENQNPNLPPINWCAILPSLGYVTKTSMHLGRITLQGKHRVVGFNGEVALGERLLNIMAEIEGEEVDVYWLDDNEGNVLKAQVFSATGRHICDVLDDLPSNRATIEQTEECRRNIALIDAYRATVESYANNKAKSINNVELIDKHSHKPGRFVIPGLKRYEAPETEAEMLPPIEEENETELVRVPRNGDLTIDNF